jgi:hypothetical protein
MEIIGIEEKKKKIAFAMALTKKFGYQDRNVLKFVVRLFLKYDKKYSKLEKRTTRIKEIKNDYEN